jgi:hypothetical protein
MPRAWEAQPASQQELLSTPLHDLSSSLSDDGDSSLRSDAPVCKRVQRRRALPLGAAFCDSLLFGTEFTSAGRSAAAGDSRCCRRVGWKQQQTYGARLLLFLTVVNLLYGVTTSWFIYINNFYLDKDLGLTPAQTQSAVATAGLCIIVRPLLGAVSDAVPILGSTRRVYFFLAATGSACCYMALAVLEPRIQITAGPAIAILCIANVLGYAWCGVILYAIVATEQRRDPVDGAAQLNAIQWGFYSTGALLGDMSEGFLLRLLDSPHRCYWVMSALWSTMALCGLLYQEGSEEEGAVTVVTAGPTSCPSEHKLLEPPLHASELEVSSEVQLLPTADDTETPPSPQPELHLRPVPEQSAADDAPAAAVEQLALEPPAQLQAVGFSVQMKKLWITLDPAGPTKGAVLSSVLYIFLTWAVVPDVSSGVTYFFYTGDSAAGGLGFGAVTYSMLAVVGDVAMLLASYVYGAYLGSTPLRRLFIGLQLLNVAASALDLALALRWNELIGIDATIFAGLDQAVFYLAWQLKNLPVYTLAAKVCPPGVEATLMACIAGCNDLSGSLAQFFGAGLTHLLGVSANDFGNVWLVYLVRTACKLLPIPLVVLVPTEDRLTEALQALSRKFRTVDSDAAIATSSSGTSSAQSAAPVEVTVEVAAESDSDRS